MQRQDIGGCVLISPYSIRYVTGMRDGAVMQNHIPLSYLFAAADGPMVYFDGETGKSIAAGLETIDELGDQAIQLSYMFAGSRMDEYMIYDGELKPGIVMCVDSYVGEVGGAEGVKLEEASFDFRG
jgi:hypothetical protein